MDANLRHELAELRSEVADGFAGVGEAIELIHNQFAEYEAKTDKRLTKLERQLA